MSQSVSEAHAFCKEVARTGKIWCIKDSAGIPTPTGDGGIKTMPFWSSADKAQDIVDNAKAYAGFEVFEISWEMFSTKWLPGLANDELLVGVNWSGEHAIGLDMEPEILKEAIEYQINQDDYSD
ncbi:DUF2750 domain-containing protein [Neptunicella sp. SCSIO 80796]|uniref:DUF2750 domain-containing protein n=1 Tax=Neptunicella plasticusilytica TaxID=3117012 RepID=UPI003A4D26B4